MNRPIPWLLIVATALLGGTLHLASRAQDARERPRAEPGGATAFRNIGRVRIPVEQRLLQPFEFHFEQETTLDALAKALRQQLDAPVVLDLAALKRLEITPASTVKLDLQGVRLKTGLKLLLDQAQLTYKVVAEDNLLILTDAEGAEEPTARLFAELKGLRGDLAKLQKDFDQLNSSIVPVEDLGPALRKPTIIEEMPGDKGRPEDPATRSRPGE